MNSFSLGCEHLSIQKLFKILNGKLKINLSEEAISKVLKSQQTVEEVVKGKGVVCGINTGFGALCNQIISTQDLSILQSNLLKSHSVGVGDSIPQDVAKLMLIIKAHCLAQGYAGITLQTLKRILWHIEEDIIPIVPSKGSVGASGDLAPLAHLFLPLIGLGEIMVKGKKRSTEEFFAEQSITPITLAPKEGLALINGTQFIASFAALGIYRLYYLLEQADIIASITVDTTLSSTKSFDHRIHDIRPFAGNKLVANRMSSLLGGSKIMCSHQDSQRIQDPYSIRYIPQIHGASRNAWLHVKNLVEIELNSITDNPVILNEQEIISCGNSDGQPLAMALDYAAMAAAGLGNIADHRCYLMLEGEKYNLPRLLIEDSGINSGFMPAKYTVAALVAENRALCFPASADSIPIYLGQEDHISMGAIGARKLNRVLDNIEYIQAIELLYATQALEFRRPLTSSAVIEEVYAIVRQYVNFKKIDAPLSPDINILKKIIASYQLQKLGQIFNLGYEEFAL
jgi:histidine ammonia-lyase